MMSSFEKSDESRLEDSSGEGRGGAAAGGEGGGAAGSSSASLGSGTDATVVLSPSYCSEEVCSSSDVVEIRSCKVHNSFVTHALKRNVLAWCAATGLSTTITIHFKGREFRLHKFPLVSRSGFMKGLLMDSKEVDLPSECPGGPEIFEMVANFCYGSTILMEASNVAALKCMAEYLDMSEDYGKANLCQRSELYLTQAHIMQSHDVLLTFVSPFAGLCSKIGIAPHTGLVSLRRWEDAIVVLHSCDGHMPLAEKLQIVSRCLDSLVIMASIEVVGPVERSLPTTRSSSGCMQEIAQSQLLMDSNCIQDLASLPCHLFVRLVVAMRKLSMQEKFVSYVITRFVDQWIVKPANQVVFERPSKLNQCLIVESVVRLLPKERNMVPTSFLSALLRCALACESSTDCRIKLEKKIALQLEHASLADLLLPSKPKAEGGSQVSKLELDSMENIIMLFISERQRAFNHMGTGPVSEFSYSCVQAMSAVGQIWDKYLSAIAHDVSLTPAKLATLIERIPNHVRLTHDHAYEAIYNYLQAHPHITEGERLILCRTIDCNKLSAEACAHAVQNEIMPLRVLVQAMFTQRLQPCAASFGSHMPACLRINSVGHHVRHRSCESLSSSFRSFESSRRAAGGLGFDADQEMLHQNSRVHAANWDCDAYHDAVSLRDDFEATESRLQSVEAELDRMRQTLVQTLNLNSRSSTRISRPVTVSSTPSGKVSSTRKSSSSSSVSSSCCMSNLKPGHRTSGLVSKALHKLKFGSSTRTNDQPAPTLAEQLKIQDEMNNEQQSASTFMPPSNDKNTPAFRTPSLSTTDISRCDIPQIYARQNLQKQS